ncbi:MAG: hypothetical protein PHC51_05775 [bacterium]|nr:hypothetical protein [bacterium]
MSHPIPFNDIVNELGGGALHRKLDQAESNNEKDVRLMTIQESKEDKLNSEVLNNKAVMRLQQMVDGRHGMNEGSFWVPKIGKEKKNENYIFFIYAELHQKEYQEGISSG